MSDPASSADAPGAAGRRRLLTDVTWTFGTSLATSGVAFLMGVLLARGFGADDVGALRLSTSAYEIAMLVALAGLPAAMVRFAAEGPARDDEVRFILRGALLTGLGGSLLLALASPFVAAVYDAPAVGPLVLVLAAGMPAAVLFSTLSSLLNGRRRMAAFAALALSNSAFTLALAAPLLWLGWGAMGVAVALAAASFLTLAVGAWLCRRELAGLFRPVATRARGAVRSFSLQTFAANLLGTLNYHADLVVVGLLLPLDKVGLYAIAVGLGRLLWLFPRAVQRITYPALARLHAQGEREEMRGLVRHAMGVTAAVLLPGAVLLAATAPDVLRLVYGEGFAEATLPLQILVVLGFPFGMLVSIGSIFASLDRLRLNLLQPAILLVSTLALTFALVPPLGLPGAALATACGSVVYASVMLWIVEAKVGIKGVMAAAGSATLAAFLCAGLAVALRAAFGPLPGIAGALLLGALGAWIVLAPEDRRALAATLGARLLPAGGARR